MSAADQIFVGIPGPELDADTTALLSEHRPGGVIFFKRNIKNPGQLGELVAAVRGLLPEAMLCLDAEGGKVDRLRDVVGPTPAATLLAKRPPNLSLQAGLWIAQSMRLFDLDVDFAPVVDLNRGAADNALDDRYLGVTPGEVTPRARAFIRGLHMGGVGACLKHFPGLGGAPADTHHKVATVTQGVNALQADLDPFDALVRLAGSTMVGHAIYPAYDPEGRPATLSPPIIGGLLRTRLRFDGLCFSDDLEMKALDDWGDLTERSALSFAAGCDVLLLCHTLEALPEVVARLEAPDLEPRRVEAHRRLETFRQRLRTLRSSRDYLNLMKDGEGGVEERLAKIRSAFSQLMEGVEPVF